MSDIQHAAPAGGHEEEHLHSIPTSFWKLKVFSTNHKTIGKQYMFTALFFLLVGGALALMIRWQLAYPWKPIPILGSIFYSKTGGVMTADSYIALVTMHATIMVFFVVVPLLVGAFGNFLIPLQIGAQDMAFPVLNMLSYWTYFISGIIALASFVVPGGAAAAGWTSYPPLSVIKTAVPGSQYGQDFWILGLTFNAAASLMGGVNFLTTIINLRAPGMTWLRLPLFIWAQFIVAMLLVLSFPVLTAGLFMLLADRWLGTAFFLPKGLMVAGTPITGGGNPILWQHVFWFLGHPEVYVLVLPGMGIASELLSVFSRKPIFGYKAMVYAMASIAGLGFIVWAHHMFQAGMNPLLAMAFMTSTMMIAMPSGVKVFNWLVTLWRGSIRLRPPMLYALAFVSLFVIGGLSGIFMAATPVDIHIHDTYFIVAHFHYIVFGGSIFALFGGLIFWFPKMFGRMMNETLCKIHFAITFISFNFVFFPMHIIGAHGHMRRIADPTAYNFLKPMQHWNILITHAAIVLGFAQLLFIANFIASIYAGKKAEENPWEANTLEWTIPSPAPYHNFEKIPTVYHGPYEYSSGVNNGKDWLAQNEKVEALA